MKKRLRLWVILSLLLLLTACSDKPQPADRMGEYIELWNEQKFAEMYELLTASAKASVTKEDFVSRYEKIYRDLRIENLQIDFTKPEEEQEPVYTFTASMDSVAGPITFTHQASWIEEKQNDKENWFVDWNTTYIFPQLGQGDKIGFVTTAAKRGSILDRNGNPLAMNGQVYEIGIVPGKMGEQKEEIIQKTAALLGISGDSIRQALEASWVKPEYFVPIKMLSLEENDLAATLSTIPSVGARKVDGRVYPLKEAAAHLIGYVGAITAEELEALEGKGYSTNDLIGKRGLEQVLDERLKGENGVKITINKAGGTTEVLAEKEVKYGENVQLTIDRTMQSKMYAQLSTDAGQAAAIHPVTGETLGLVSSPSFDPNLLTLGATSAQWSELQNNPQKPLLNRFAANFSPGSVIKPLTAAIALKEGVIHDETSISINGLQWQKDSSWGNYYVTRVIDPGTAVNLEKAMLYSDNIYFAQAALNLGRDKLANGFKEFGFEEEIPYAYPLESSETGAMDSEIALADSGYGQGQVEMNIVHLAATYTPFVNNGNLITPTLLLEEKDGQVWKENIISPENTAKLNAMMKQVIDHPQGTGFKAKIEGRALAGKTGTAELKEKQGGRGMEYGWFVVYNIDTPSLLVAMMVEGVQDQGGSEYVVEKAKHLFMP